jgi:hypothetical protein
MFLWVRYFVVLLLALFAVLPGCGRKLDLIPPQELVPVAINDLRDTLDENGVTLTWTYPARLKNGDNLSFIENFTVLRADIPEEQFCEGCPVEFKKSEDIPGGALPGPGKSRTAEYGEGNLQYGYRYLYKVRSQAVGGYIGGDSNMISFTWRPPPKAPQEVQVEPGDSRITLKWQPVLENIQGDALGVSPMYKIYRKKGMEQFIGVNDFIREPAFTDIGLENDTFYSYRVRAFVRIGGSLQAGEASQIISAKPRDLTPPTPPRNLLAIKIPAGIKLVWQAVTDEDLAGYRVYRREENAPRAELIAEIGSDLNQYVDQETISARKVFYSVTSFDRAEPANESQPSPEVFIDMR